MGRRELLNLHKQTNGQQGTWRYLNYWRLREPDAVAAESGSGAELGPLGAELLHRVLSTLDPAALARAAPPPGGPSQG